MKTYRWLILVILVLLLSVVFIMNLVEDRMSTATSSSDSSYGLADMNVRDQKVGGGEDATMMVVQEEMALTAPGIAPMPPDDGMSGSVVAPDSIDRLIIRNGSISLVVDDVRGVVDLIQALVEGSGGFVVSSNIDEFAGRAPSAEISLRVPATSFGSALQDIRTFGIVENEYVTGRDMTEEYVDLSAQLGNLEATEQQFLSIMNRAVEIADVLAVQRELSYVRQQIEQIEGRMQYLTESAQFSLLTVSLSTDPSELPVLDADDWRPRVIALDAVRTLLDFGKGILSAVIWLVIFTPVWLVCGGVGYLWYRRYHK